MKKKILVALGIGIVAIAGAGTVYATRSQKAKSSSDQAYELGQMIQEQDKETDIKIMRTFREFDKLAV